MKIQYFFSSAKGDIPLGPSELALPFKITPSEVHPFLTLQDYFDAIIAFLFMDEGKRLHALLERELHRPLGPGRIQAVRLFSEKHGALYHVVRAEIDCDAGSVALAVSTALTPEAKACLSREYETLGALAKAFPVFAFLPKTFYCGRVRKRTPRGEAELSFLLAQWLKNYHEWHLVPDRAPDRAPDKEGCRICIWDQTGGRRFASSRETWEVFRQASKILTLYYDTRTYCQIYPWHHAAGDFIIRAGNGAVDVKLTTVRGYAPVMTFLRDARPNPFIAIIYFLLNLTVKMRLDRQEGTGKTLWAGNTALQAVVRGFFDGLKIMEGQHRYALGVVEDLLELLKSFDGEEMLKLFDPLEEFYREEMPQDCSVIGENLREHGRQLYRIIQSFRIGDHPGES